MERSERVEWSERMVKWNRKIFGFWNTVISKVRKFVNCVRDVDQVGYRNCKFY